MKKIILTITIISILIITGCTQTTQNEDELLILTSTFPLYEFAKEIAPQENVQMLVPPGVDIHHYDLKPSDLVKLEQANLIIFIGEEMEPWLEAVLDLEGKHKEKTLQATKKVQLIKAEHTHGHSHERDEHEHSPDDELEHLIEEIDHIVHEWENGDITSEDALEEIEDLLHKYLDDDHHHDSEYDPHIWLDFENSIEIVNAITTKLSTMNPEQTETYRANADEYIKKLRQLDQNYQTGLRNCEINAFITNHDSFRYLANKYDLKQIPIRGLSAEQEPSPKTITNIIKEAREHDIKHVFFEELASPRVSEALAKEIGAETLMLSPGENIPAKDFGQKTFIDLMNQNLENLRIGLRCE